MRSETLVVLIGYWCDRNRLSTPEHEGAHVVVARRLGLPVAFASVVPETDEASGFKMDGYVLISDTTEARGRVHLSSKGAPLTDMRRATRHHIIASGDMPWRELLAQMRQTTRKAAELLCERQNWTAMKRLSVALATRGTMTASEIQKVLDQSDALCAGGDYAWPLIQGAGPALPPGWQPAMAANFTQRGEVS